MNSLIRGSKRSLKKKVEFEPLQIKLQKFQKRCVLHAALVRYISVFSIHLVILKQRAHGPGWLFARRSHQLGKTGTLQSICRKVGFSDIQVVAEKWFC